MQPIRPQSKAHELCTQLTALAHRIGPGGKFPTVAQLCRALEVSPTTLNGALGVLEVQQIISRRRGSGIFVSKELIQIIQTRLVSLICDPTYVSGANHSPFWDMLLENVKQRAEVGHEELEMHFARLGSEHTPEAILNEGLLAELQSGRVSGVLSVGLSQACVQWIEALGVPIVAYAGPAKYTVEHDGNVALRLGIAELARANCRHIGFWGVVQPNVSLPRVKGTLSLQKEQGFREALSQAGLTFEPLLFRLNRHLLRGKSETDAFGVTTLSRQEQGYQTALEVFGAPRETWPEGLFIDDDLMTAGALAALHRLGVVPGRDVAIASIANRESPILLGHEAELFLIEYDPREFVEAMFSRLEDLMDGKPTPEGAISIVPRLHPAVLPVSH